MNKLSFSGHESFICKQFWLKKIFDFANEKSRFSDETSVVNLGVGKNMVVSLRFWGKAFGILDDSDSPSEMAEYLFGKKGKDIYLEDHGTIWLLHYHLVKSNKASIYNLVFNEFRKERIDFTRHQLLGFIIRKCKELNSNTDNENTFLKDINVFLRTYVKPQKDDKVEVEDDFAGALIDLDLVKHYKQRNAEGKMTDWYKIEGEDRADLPYQIILYTILDTLKGQKSISFRELQAGQNSPGTIFALNTEGLYNKLSNITEHYKEVIYTETAGNQLLQFKSELKPQDILNDYYGK